MRRVVPFFSPVGVKSAVIPLDFAHNEGRFFLYFSEKLESLINKHTKYIGGQKPS